MKKMIALAVVFALMCSSTVVGSAANLQVSANADTIAPGETVVVTISLDEDIPASEGVTVMQGTLTYDSTVLQYQSVEKVSKDLTSASKHASQDKVIFHYLSMDAKAKHFHKGTLVKVTFQAKEATTVSQVNTKLSFTAKVQNAQGKNVGDVAYDSSVSVTVTPKYSWGDADGNGMVNAKDAMLVLQYYTKKISAEKLNKDACDVDGNASLNAKDAMLILQRYTKKISLFPIEKG